MKFRPRLTRIKLNPEQAVLTCVCWNGSGHYQYGRKINNLIYQTVCTGRAVPPTVQHIFTGPSGHWWDSDGYYYLSGAASS